MEQHTRFLSMDLKHIFIADFTIIQLPTGDGKTTFMYKKHTYSYSGGRDKRYLQCSRSRRGKCKAKLTLDEHGKVCSPDPIHNHPAPRYHITAAGIYIRC